jgi:hypothetical protein
MKEDFGSIEIIQERKKKKLKTQEGSMTLVSGKPLPGETDFYNLWKDFSKKNNK